MARGVPIVLAAFVVLLLGGTLGAYAYDSSHENQIAEGVQVSGLEVGGMDAADAKQLLRKRVAKPLKRPVTVKHDGVEYRLSADRLDIGTDIGAMVDAALAASRDGSLPERVWRYATGSEVNSRINPEVTYSEEAVDEFVAKVAEEIDVAPVDATVEPTPSSLELVDAEVGREVRKGELRERVVDAALSANGRVVKAPVQKLEPDVTKEQLAERYPTYITVDRAGFKLRLWKSLELEKTYTIAVGQAGYDTPTGVYTLQNKAVDPAWHVPNSDWAGELAGRVIPPGPENPIKSRWMGIYDGAGIHGTDDLGSLGSAASRGCIRMAIPEVKELYERVDVGTPIFIGG